MQKYLYNTEQVFEYTLDSVSNNLIKHVVDKKYASVVSYVTVFNW